MKIRKLTRHEVQAEPFRVWNAYVELLAMKHYRDLAPEQRPAHLVFWYESEVQNGGHLQYFENRGTEHLNETIDALKLLGASCQHEVLRDAGELWRRHLRPRIRTSEEFCETALEGEFSVYDRRFHECLPTLQNCLETYLDQHQALFVIVT